MNMKRTVGLLTLDSRVYNYGGILQEYALWKSIEDMGYSCEIIDYDLTSEVYTFSIKRSILNLSLKKILDKVGKIKKKEKESIDITGIITNRKKLFDDFRSNMKYSNRMSYSDLFELQKSYSSVVCGSDQIWNPDYNVPSFFLTFVNKPTKAVIYAASIGKALLTGHQLLVYKNLMKSIDFISVREKSAQQLLKGYTDKKIELVLDPTLLLSRDTWILFANQVNGMKDKYVFCYFLENNSEKREPACQYAKENNLQLIAIPYLHGSYSEIDSNMSNEELDIGPKEFLNLIFNAECVLTDSFHACVFSIIFDIKFRVFGRQSGNYNMNTRVETLLSYFDLNDCLIEPSDLKMNISKLKKSEKEFLKLKECSLRYLRDALG